MDLNNDTSNVDHIVFKMLDKLKSNGTFDEFRRHCISDIDAKPTFQNWRQRIESNVHKFLNKVDYTPELNKNTTRERLRRHLFEGRETLDIEEGADRILTQVLAPRTISMFEPSIAMAVNEHFGIANETAQVEVNGLNQSNMHNNVTNISDNEINTSYRPKTNIICTTDNAESIDEISPEFEPLCSVLDNDNSNDESISGMSDLVSIGSPVQIVSKENNDTSSNGFETDKTPVEKPQQTIEKNGIVNHKNDNIINELNNASKISNNIEKSKTNDVKSTSKHHSSRKTSESSSRDKSSSHRSKDRNSSTHRSSSSDKNDSKKRSSSYSKDKKSSNHRKQSDSKDKDKKHKHKKSHHSDRDKTPKRDRKDSRSDKKEKSSNYCKEPKSLNGNRSDDESNAGGSSKQKNNEYKNKSSTSDKSKSSSSTHKSSRKDNGTKDVVDKPKDKSSGSTNTHSSSIKSSRDKTKRKRSLDEEIKNPDKEGKKSKLSDTKITNKDAATNDDHQNAANILLSISVATPSTSSMNEVKSENVVFVENSYSTEVQSKIPLNTTHTSNSLKVQEHVVEKKVFPIIVDDNAKQNLDENHVKSFNLLDSIDRNVDCKKSTPNSSSDNLSFDNKKCVTKVLSHNDVGVDKILQKNTETVSIDPKLPKDDIKKINDNMITDTNQMTNEHSLNKIFKSPKPKLLPNQIDSIKRKTHSKNNKLKTKKIKLSKFLATPTEVIASDVDSAPTVVKCERSNLKNNCDSEINEPTNISDTVLNNDKVKNSMHNLDDDKLLYTFKGFSEADSVPSNHFEQFKHFVETLETINGDSIVDNNEFKGFDDDDVKPCKYKRDLVYSQLILAKEQTGFKGFTEEETIVSKGYKYVKQQLELAEKQINVENQPNIMNIAHGGNGIQGSTKLNEIMTIVYENNKDNTNEIHSQLPNNEASTNCPAVNNNNHDLSPTNHWVVAQEMKYKLLPVKVKLERLFEIRCNNTKHVSDSPKVSNTSQRSTFK